MGPLQWMPVHDGRYMVSERGDVYSVPRTVRRRASVDTMPDGSQRPREATSVRRKGQMLGQWTNANGYREAVVSVSGTKRKALVHRLVLLAFAGPPPAGLHVAHWDGDPTNNHVSNLRYATPAENVGADRARHGRGPVGVRNGRATLTPELVQRIDRLRDVDGVPLKRIAREMGIPPTTLSMAYHRKTWAHVPKEVNQ